MVKLACLTERRTILIIRTEDDKKFFVDDCSNGAYMRSAILGKPCTRPKEGFPVDIILSPIETIQTSKLMKVKEVKNATE